MNQAYIYWQFTQQLEEQRTLGSRVPRVVPPAKPRRIRWSPTLRRSRRGQEVVAQRAPMGCAV